jgi:hypothetical protein
MSKLRWKATFNKWVLDRDKWLTLAIIVLFIILFFVAVYITPVYAEKPFAELSTFTEHNDVLTVTHLKGFGYVLMAEGRGCSDNCVTTFWLLYKHVDLEWSGLAVRPLTLEQARNLRLEDE